MMHSNFNGVFAALTTPFIEDRISPEKLRENIKKYNRFQLSGYVVLGSTGESVYLTDEESEKLVEAAKESASKEKMIIVGTARESTNATLEFTNRMAGLGIDAALIRTPSYFKSLMCQEALKKHYLTIAEQAKVPLLIYNIPRNTGISVDSNLVIELSQHDNIAGIKDSSGNLSFLGEFLPRISPKFHVLLGAGSVFLEGLLLGAKGGILALAAVVPGLCVKLYELFSEKNLEEALRLQLQLIPLNKAIIQTYGIPGIKYALDLLGYNGGSPRLPLLPLDEKGKEEIKTLLDELGLL
ncbi:MAG: dihydrodipicolinate synthase family protein [Candidatus Aminicenantes bacterium]|nr:dihydrodipicolinate synthase family protein [Candidatus Aminicenantes bacterium]